MTKGELLYHLEPFNDELLLQVRLPNGDVAGINSSDIDYRFDPGDYEAVVILSVIRPTRPERI